MEEKVMNQNEEITTETEDTKDTNESQTEIVIGIVSGCKNLNIRKNPVVNPKNVLCVVPKDTHLEIINPEKATKEWYKVELEDGTTGFCMKEFVSVNE